MADPIVPPDQPQQPQPQSSLLQQIGPFLQQWGPTLGAAALGYLRGAGSPRIMGASNAAATGLGTALDAYSGLSQMAQQQQANQARGQALRQMDPQTQRLAAIGVTPDKLGELAVKQQMRTQLITDWTQKASDEGRAPEERKRYADGVQMLHAGEDPDKVMPYVMAKPTGRPLTAAQVRASAAADPGNAALQAQVQALNKEERERAVGKAQATSGVVLSREKALKDYEESKKTEKPKTEQQYRAMLAADPTNPELQRIVRSFDEQKAATEGVKTTAATRTMKESAPKVVSFVDRIDKLVDVNEKQLGPAAGRWAEFMTGKVGAPNPEFAKLRTDIGLLTTQLMRMHVGARGGVELMHHFAQLIDSGKQSPENLRAALGEIKAYAQSVGGQPITEEESKPTAGVQPTHRWNPETQTAEPISQ